MRPAFDALIDIDDALRNVVATSTQPALGAIRLAWWRDALERLDQAPPPAEPRLRAAASDLLPRGVTGATLAALADGASALLDEAIDWTRVGAGGEALFAIGAQLTGEGDPQLGEAGRLYALGRAIRLGFDAPKARGPGRGHRFTRRLRPLTALARLAARDLSATGAAEPEATPARAAALLAHRFTGTIA